MVAKVFFRAVAEPDAKGLGDLFFLGFGEAIVELEGAVAFAAAGFVLVGVPVGAGEADAAGAEVAVSDAASAPHPAAAVAEGLEAMA